MSLFLALTFRAMVSFIYKYILNQSKANVLIGNQHILPKPLQNARVKEVFFVVALGSIGLGIESWENSGTKQDILDEFGEGNCRDTNMSPNTPQLLTKCLILRSVFNKIQFYAFLCFPLTP